MKTSIHFLFGAIFFAVVSLTFSSCSKKDNPEKLLKGKVTLTIGITIAESDVSSRLKSGTDDFSVQVFTSGNNPVISFAHASEIPDLLELPEGSYYAVASSDNSLPVSFFFHC